jgi:hypothetical protein
MLSISEDIIQSYVPKSSSTLQHIRDIRKIVSMTGRQVHDFLFLKEKNYGYLPLITQSSVQAVSVWSQRVSKSISSLNYHPQLPESNFSLLCTYD